MNAPPPLTDRPALDRFRARAAQGAALFLHHDAADEVQERLSEVNRRFTAPACVTPFASVWRNRWPEARIVADTATLDLPVGEQDVVIHALGLHWADDPLGQIIQCRRALMPDGLFLGVTFGGQTLHELRASLAQAEVEVTGGLSPRIVPMGEIRDLGGLLQRAGLALPVADSFMRTLIYRDLVHLMHDLRAMGEGNALATRHRAPLRRAILARAQDLYAQAYGDAMGRLPATVETIVLTGWAPADSQPKPLRPGSAAARLADALGGVETPLRDARIAAPGATKD